MKERPILFSAPMVRAILEGRKTQTRRAVNGVADPDEIEVLGDSGEAFMHSGACESFCDYACGGAVLKCPYGIPGDRLWVKEKWRPAWHHEIFCCVQYAADSSYRKPTITDEDRGLRFADMCEQSGDHAEPWHPSIHMWREFSRLMLEITGIRVERLQEISDSDAIAEGARNHAECEYWDPCRQETMGPGKHEFMRIWNAINGKCSWDANPWVWVIEFKRIEARP